MHILIWGVIVLVFAPVVFGIIFSFLIPTMSVTSLPIYLLISSTGRSSQYVPVGGAQSQIDLETESFGLRRPPSQSLKKSA